MDASENGVSTVVTSADETEVTEEVGTATESAIAPNEPPCEENYKVALLARICEPIIVDQKWSLIQEAIVSSASSNQCTREHLDEIYASIGQLLVGSDPTAAREGARDKRHTNKRRTNRERAPTRAQNHFYARCQDLYNENPKKLAELVVVNDFSLLEKSCSPGVEDVRALYEQLWSQRRPDTVSFEGVNPPSLGTEEVLTPVTREEVKAKLASDVAAGFDGTKKGCLRAKDTDTILALHFNLLMLKSHYLSEWKKTALLLSLR